jgi:dipeptidase D
MSHAILNLEPVNLWKYFYELTQIPRPSKSEARVREYIVNFGKEHHLETLIDEVGNVIIRKPATPGMENLKGVILQAHLDMVPQKNSDKVHDFEKDPIEPMIQGEWVTATGTTLGADNGIGVAAALAVLASQSIAHGPIEGLFTIDEETGMTGAFGLKSGLLHGHILLNMDSEDEGELYVGCAGGTNANVKFSYKEVPVTAGMASFRLSVTGLKGGHSGIDIPLERGNANKILTRILWHGMRKHGLRLASIDGGSLRNAIPREAFAVITIPVDKKAEFLECFQKLTETVFKEFASVDPGLKITAEVAETPGSLMDESTQHNLLYALYACPNGVMRMSMDMPGIVETSNNLAIVKSENGVVRVQSLLRSSVDSAKEDLEHMIRCVFELADADIIFDGHYPGWKPNPGSAILHTMKHLYEKKFGKIPEIKAIHAGLECGLLGGVYPLWDMISFGPTIRHPHSPDEKVNIQTVQKFWDFLVEVLKEIPAR